MDLENEIRILINEFDPCGFIAWGAPIDEYDCLTHKIVECIISKNTNNDIKDLILHEIEHHFETPDLELLKDPYKTKFYNDLDNFLKKIEILK